MNIIGVFGVFGFTMDKINFNKIIFWAGCKAQLTSLKIQSISKVHAAAGDKSFF